jgi:hypothetical protein
MGRSTCRDRKLSVSLIRPRSSQSSAAVVGGGREREPPARVRDRRDGRELRPGDDQLLHRGRPGGGLEQLARPAALDRRGRRGIEDHRAGGERGLPERAQPPDLREHVDRQQDHTGRRTGWSRRVRAEHPRARAVEQARGSGQASGWTSTRSKPARRAASEIRLKRGSPAIVVPGPTLESTPAAGVISSTLRADLMAPGMVPSRMAPSVSREGAEMPSRRVAHHERS